VLKPEGWKRTTLADVADFRNGLNFVRGERGYSVKVVGVGDFQQHETLADFSETATVTITNEIGKDDLLQDDDLLFVRSNGNKALVGRCVLISGVKEPVTFSGFTIRARVKSSAVDHSYLSKLVRSPLFLEHLHRRGGGSSINNLSQEALAEFYFGLPPLSEQRKIAEILRTWDAALEKLTALREAKLKRHRGLTMALVFGGWQLERFRKTNEVTPYRWFELPGSWNCQHIGDLATEISERNGEGEEHEVLSCSKYDGFVRSLEYFKKQVFSADLSGYKKIWRGDFGFPSNHVEEGSIGLQNLTDIGVVSPIYTVFRFNSDQVNAEYAFAVLKTELYRHIFEVSTSASVDRRGSLRWSEFSRLAFPVPPLDEQEAIADVLRTSRRELDALTDEIESVSRQKRGLMQKLLTGEWRVKLEAPVA